MDVGRLDKRITLCCYQEVENELEQTEQVLTDYKTVWASVEPVRGREYQEAQKLRPELTYKITTRYHKISPDMIITYKDRQFEIVSIINIREKNAVLELVCTELINTPLRT